MEKENIFKVTNDMGCKLAVRVIRPGMSYGAYNIEENKWALTLKEGAEPQIEFYDEAYAHSPYGQFINRYLLSTMMQSDSGINLYGGVEQWFISKNQLQQALVGLGLKKMDRNQRARSLAEEICKDFTYESIANPVDGGGSVEIWRCKGKDFDHAHDIAITRMGIAVFGDMDPLTFSVGAEYGMKFLAGKDVGYYIHSKLSSDSRNVTVDKTRLTKEVKSRLLNCRNDSHTRKFLNNDLEGKELLSLLSSCYSDYVDANENSPIPFLTDAINLFEEVEYLNDTNSLSRLFGECNNFGSSLEDLDVFNYEVPTENLLTRLHILNIGAQRILAQQEAEKNVQRTNVFRQRESA